MILAGDTGGTKTRLGLYVEEKGELVCKKMETFHSSAYSGLVELVSAFLQDNKVTVTNACFGVPGPLIGGEAKATNLPWRLKEDEISAGLKIESLRLVNDLVATAAALPHLANDKLHILHQGKKTSLHNAICGVLAPGTGLGQSFLNYRDGTHFVFGSEGGHVDFAPRSDLEVELFQYLKAKFDRVSYERVVCGPGLVNIYEFLKGTGRAGEPAVLAQRLQNQDAAAVISAAGMNGEFDICVKALDIFASALGAQAGNLVLTMLATGGIFLGGGIPPKIIKKLEDGTTVSAYTQKGRLSDLVKDTSLYVIMDDKAAISGAAHLAAEM